MGTVVGGIKGGFGCAFGVLGAIVVLFIILVIIVAVLNGGDSDNRAAESLSEPRATTESSSRQREEEPGSFVVQEQQDTSVASRSGQQQGIKTAQRAVPSFTPYEDEEGGRTSAGVAFSTSRDPIDDALTSVAAIRRVQATEFDFEPALLVVGCFEGSFQVLVTGMPFTFLESELDVEYRFDKRSAVSATWDIMDDDSLSTTASPPDDRTFEQQVRNADALAIRGRSNADEVETYEFTLDGLFDTPVQPNLDHCG